VGTAHSVPLAGHAVPHAPQWVTESKLVQAPEQHTEPLAQAWSALLSLSGSVPQTPRLPGIAHELHGLPLHALLQQ
jgi:hypothetical protein